MRPLDRWHSAAVAVAMSVLAVGSMATPVQAVVPPLAVTFQASFHACVRGVSNAQDMRVELRDASDVLLDTSTPDPVVVDGAGHFEACFSSALVAPGEKLVATSAQHSGPVTFTIPVLSVHVDRVTDVVSGSSIASHALTVKVNDCRVGSFIGCPRVATRSTTTNASGHYSKDLTSAFDVHGSDRVTVTYTSGEGHTYSVSQVTPFFAVGVGTHRVTGVFHHGQHATFRLKTKPGGSSLGTRNVTDDVFATLFTMDFGFTLHAGQQVSSTMASDARITIPGTSTTFPIEHHDQKIRTHCLPGRKVTIYWDGPLGAAVRTADSHGVATVNLSSAESIHRFRLPHGSSVTIACENAAGDVIQRTVIVP